MPGAASIGAAPMAQAVPDFGLIKNISPLDSSVPHDLTACCNGLVVFSADDGTNGFELWKTNGTETGTAMVMDINPTGHSLQPGLISSGPPFLTTDDGTIFFAADDGTNGRELWKTDGTAAGTMLEEDVNPGVADSAPRDLTLFGGATYFSADDGTSGRELHQRDLAGDFKLADIQSGAGGSSLTNLTVAGTNLFFTADDGTNGVELWATDGSTSGSTLIVTPVKDINTGGSSSPGHLTILGGTLSFTADDGTNGQELWISDGTGPGTVMVRDIRSGAGSSFASGLTDVGGTLFFTADDGANGQELWTSDGTEGGTVLVKDIQPGVESSFPFNLADVDGTLLFGADDGTNGSEPWSSDGTAGGTAMIKDVATGAPSSNPGTFIDGGNAGPVAFVATDATSGREWWLTDLTEGGTKLFFDLNPGSEGSFPGEAVISAGELIFAAAVTAAAQNPPEDQELYRASRAQFEGLEITKTHDAGSGAKVGQWVNYFIKITNHGPDVRTDLKVIDVHGGPTPPRWVGTGFGGTGGAFSEAFAPKPSALTAASAFIGAQAKVYDQIEMPVGSTFTMVPGYRMPSSGTYTNTATIQGGEGAALATVTVSEEKAVKLAADANPPVGTVVNADQITGGTINGQDGGCQFAHVHGAITIDGSGPLVDPFPTGCGWGSLFALPAFHAVDGVLGVAGLQDYPNEVIVYDCGDTYVCVDTNGVTLSANPASPDFDTSTAGATIASTTSFVLGGGSGADTLTFGSFAGGPPTTTEMFDRFLSAGGGDDTATCTGPGGCALVGGDGNDTLVGGTGPDALLGGSGNDNIDGQAGDDHFVFLGPVSSPETDTIVEAAAGGTDTLDFSGLTSTDPVTVNLSTDVGTATHINRTVNTGAAGQVDNFEIVIGGAGDDSITLGFLPVASRTIDGSRGEDTLTVDAGGGFAIDSPGAPGAGTITSPGGMITYVNIENVILPNAATPPATPSSTPWGLIVAALLLAGLLYSRLGGVGTRKA